MIIYTQSTGHLTDSSGALWGVGYAGRGAGLNNPAEQATHDVGPLPCGIYTFGQLHNDPKLGLDVMALTPDPSNEMLGRFAFYFHGDNRKQDFSASHGCIVLGPVVRKRISKLEDRTLRVIATPAVPAVQST